MSRRAETAFRPPSHACARPSASPAGLGRLLRSVGKLGKLSVRGRYRAEYGKPAGDARCASCAGMSRRAETAFRPPPHARARPLASPAGLGRLLRSMGKLGRLSAQGEGATAPNIGNRRGMRGAHPARACLVGLKLRFARRRMPAQGLRPPPPDWEGCFAAWENWERKSHGKMIEGSLSAHASSILGAFLNFPSRRNGGLPNLPGTAKGRAPGTTPHEACFNVALERRSRAKRAPAVSLLRRGSASLPWGGRYRADFGKPANARCASCAGMV